MYVLWVWRSYQIGEGKLIDYAEREIDLPRLDPVHAVSTEGGQHLHNLRGDHHWAVIRGRTIRPSDQLPVVPTAANDDEEPHECDEGDFGTPVQNEDDDPDTSEGPQRKRLFTCPEEGCTKVYQLHQNWHKHVTTGSHTKRAERKTLRDISIETYLQQIEQQQLFSTAPAVRVAMARQHVQNLHQQRKHYQLKVGSAYWPSTKAIH